MLGFIENLLKRLNFLVSWISDDTFRLKAAYWANIVTYRIYTRALGAIGTYLDKQK